MTGPHPSHVGTCLFIVECRDFTLRFTLYNQISPLFEFQIQQSLTGFEIRNILTLTKFQIGYWRKNNQEIYSRRIEILAKSERSLFLICPRIAVKF